MSGADQQPAPGEPLGDRVLVLSESSQADSAAPKQNGNDFSTMDEAEPAEKTPDGDGKTQGNGVDGGMSPQYQSQGSDSFVVLVLLAAIFLAFALYLGLFSEIGFGATLFKVLMKAARLYVPVAGLGFILVVVSYIVDFDYGHFVINYFVFSLVALCMVLAAMLCFSSMPHAPLMAFMVTCTAYFSGIYISVFKNKISPDAYVKCLAKACLIGGLAGFIASCVWAGINNCWWGTDCKRRFRNVLRICNDTTTPLANFSTPENGFCQQYGSFGTTCEQGCVEVPVLSACDPALEHCLAAFMLWSSPFLMSVVVFLFGIAMNFIAESAIEANSSKQGFGMNKKFKIFMNAMIFLCMLLWLGASIAAASMQLSNVIVSFAFLGLVMLAAIMAVAFGGMQKMRKSVSQIGAIKKLTQDPFYVDSARGMAIFVAGPLFILFLPVAYLKRSIRKCRSHDGPADIEAGENTPPQGGGKVFKEVAAIQMIKDSKTWRWTSILNKTWNIGFLYFALQAIVMTMTTMFMAWLNKQLAGFHVGVICVIIIFICLLMFAVPVIPGVPAYLACGVIIGATEKQIGSFGLTLLLAWVIASVSKLLACLMQQKVFGQMLGKSLWVRSTLGVNQPVMKAINLILQEKGLTVGKVAILVGGPDWPTSVLTGVLNLPALQMQIGTLPVLFPIAMIVLTGGAMLKTGENPDSLWVPLSAVFMTVSGGLQVAIALVAVKYTNAVTKDRAAEIEAMPNDEEVEKFDASQQQLLAEKNAAMDWKEQSTLWRCVLVISTMCIVISGWIFKLCNCFEDVVLTTDIDLPPFNGQFLKVFKMWGWIGLAVQVTSWVFCYAFSTHISMLVKSRRKLSRVDQDPDAEARPIQSDAELPLAQRNEIATATIAS